MASLKDALAPTLLVAGAVFAAFATPLVFVGERQVTIRMDRDVVYDGLIRDVSLPYIAFSLVVSMGAGLTTMTVAGWNSSTKRNITLENERESLRAEIHEKEVQIDELKLSSANLAAAGLDAFLDAAAAMPQAPEVIAEMLTDDPFITVEPAAPAVAPQPSQGTPPITMPQTPISGEILHVYGVLQDRFEQAVPASKERSPAPSRAYVPNDLEPALPSILAPEVASFYTALYGRLQTTDLPSPAQRGIAPSRAYVPEAPRTTHHIQAQAPHTYQPLQSAPAAVINLNSLPEPLASQLAQSSTQAQPYPAVVEAHPATAQAKLPEETSQAMAAYAVLGLSDTAIPQPPVQSDIDLEQLTALLESDIDKSSAPPLPWDQWLEESTLPTSIPELPVPVALAGLEAWLAPATTADPEDDSVVSDWEQWLQQQSAPKRHQSRSNLDDWLAACNTDDKTAADPDFFEMPLAAPDTRMPKVVRFQRGSTHSRKDS